MNKIHYNSPVILTFSIIAFFIHLINVILIPNFTYIFFSSPSAISLNPFYLIKFVSYALGHASWQHLFSNLPFILLLGPILEEKYGSLNILLMMIVTAFLTSCINAVFFSTSLVGASGIVFMFIILISLVNVKEGSIPLTFLLVGFIFVGKEFVNGISVDKISQMSHILGGASGAFFGFIFRKTSN